MANRTISVVMPVYNAERYVSEAIESILQQTFRDFEFIIVDDGSTDGSLKIIRQYEAADSRIVVVSRPNTGIVGALNDGLDKAQGDFVARMDADDIARPERFERQVAFLNKHAECVGVGSAFQMIDSDGDAIRNHQWTLDPEEISREIMTGRGGLAHPTAMLRRKCMIEVGAYRAEMQYAEDVDLWLRMSERGWLANLPDVLLKYRVHGGNLCITRAKQQWLALRMAVAEAHERRGLTCLEFDVPEPPEPETPEVTTKRMIWESIEGREFHTARKHAWRLLTVRSHSVSLWFLMASVLLAPISKSASSTLVRADLIVSRSGVWGAMQTLARRLSVMWAHLARPMNSVHRNASS